MSRERGQVVFFNIGKKWGWVKHDSSARQWFFHCDNSPGFEARLGLWVTFEIAPPIKFGLKDQAIKLEMVEAPAAITMAESGVGGGL